MPVDAFLQTPTISAQQRVEGEKKRRFVTTYARDPRLRQLAIKIHGVKCVACGFDFRSTYGSHGSGFIHVHHLEPVSGLGGKTEINPKSDMTVLCANCHSMVHRFKGKTLSLEQLKKLILSQLRMKSLV
jgi:5-methylcytosine-specific restriction enzyme A